MNQFSAQDPLFTPDFLNSILGAEPARILQVKPELLTGPKSFNASLWRLNLTYDPPHTAAPRSLVAKLPTPRPELNERAPVFQPGTRENWFYRSGAPRSPIAVPHCYYNAVDPTTGQSILVLEDLAPALPGSQLMGATLLQAGLALKSAARLHAAWWEAGTRAEIQELTRILAGTWNAEQALVQDLYDAAWPQFLLQNYAAIPDEVRDFGAEIVGNMKSIDALMDQSPKTLAHGDFRLDNLLFGERDGSPACWVLDWEDVFFGSGMVDVSWFLGGCLPAAKSQHETGLLQTYYQALTGAGVQAYSWEECFADYRRAMCGNFVQGVLSAVLEEEANAYDRQLARAIAERFIVAVQRLRLIELIRSSQ